MDSSEAQNLTKLIYRTSHNPLVSRVLLKLNIRLYSSGVPGQKFFLKNTIAGLPSSICDCSSSTVPLLCVDVGVSSLPANKQIIMSLLSIICSLIIFWGLYPSLDKNSLINA